jgi:hypothetical protein
MNIKRGAPFKPPDEIKGNVVQIRLTDAEKIECELAAEADGLKMSAWARQTLVKAASRNTRKKNSGRSE